MPAPSQAGVAPAGGCGGEGEEQEFEIRSDEGFVYKVPSGIYPDAAPSTQASAGPDPKAAGLRRRRRALLRLRAKRLRQLSRWEALASELLAPLPAPRPPASQSPPSSPHPVAADAPASTSVLDELIAQAEVQAELLKKLSQWCDESNMLCDAQEAAIVDSIVALPLWGNPSDLVASLCSSDEDPAPGGGFQSLDSQQGSRATGVAATGIEMIKGTGEKRIQGPYQCKRCSKFSHSEEICCETHGGLGNELPEPILTENGKRKEPVSSRVSNSAAEQAPNRSKSHKASGSKSTASGTPGSMTRKAASTPRAPDTLRSPGPTTRRAAAQKNVSPRSS
ncbi:hypothetical protein U9M48_022900 [Paspalum notatum var. saurae]|uniref:Uncharacterized protein n=1 Tax=Paspalum notatum var. saurae TaxID=547442 RepID=A0AAQ3WUJ2_PASNO